MTTGVLPASPGADEVDAPGGVDPASALPEPSAEQYRAEPAAALAAVSSHSGPVLLDLDETLYLRNSTEDFIDLARPGLVALLLLRLLELLRPWRWSGGEVTRDVWRVQLVHRLFPWTLARWQARVGELATRYANRPLLEALGSRAEPPVIVTIGFLPIVTPLVRALGLSQVRIVAARLNSFADRRCGKLHAAVQALGEPAVHSALLLTDSEQDLPLLRSCARPLYTLWPDARYRRALADVYLPGQYISQVKRPGEHYFRRAVLQEDFALWVLSSVALTAAPVHHVAGLLLLLASFWIIYERGYVDNDLMGAKLEKDPKLSAAFHLAPVATPFWPPWIWASAIGAAGVWILHSPTGTVWSGCIRWLGVLIATYGWFYWYNRTDKQARVWMFAVLQLARTAAFVPLLAVTPVGAMALGAHVLSRWTPYYLYRLSGKDWPRSASVGLVRVLFFLVMALMLAIATGITSVMNWTAAAILGWSLFRARYDLRPIAAGGSATPRSG